MGKFEKGQRLRVIDNAGAPLRYVKGETGLVEEVYAGNMVRLAGKSAGMYEHRFEAWQPKVGDRVRVVKAVLAHKYDYVGREFTVTKEAYKVDSGVQTWGGDNAGGFVWRTDELEPLTVTVAAPVAAQAQPATLTIEAGKFYKTRDGRKVGPVNQRDGYLEVEFFHYSTTGECCFLGKSGDDTHPKRDLIAEWVDEPTAEPAKANNDNAAPLANPKFKVGDRVKVTTSRHGESQLGKTGVVINDNYRGGDLTIEIRYDTPMPSGLDHNQYSVSDLELVAAPASTPAIVALIENGTAKPSTRPKVHSDQASATTEAERLALEFPGQQFGVFVLADSKIADVVNVPTAILRAA